MEETFHVCMFKRDVPTLSIVTVMVFVVVRPIRKVILSHKGTMHEQ